MKIIDSTDILVSYADKTMMINATASHTDDPFNLEMDILELQDVGLTSLVITDCKALLKMAKVLNSRTKQIYYKPELYS